MRNLAGFGAAVYAALAFAGIASAQATAPRPSPSRAAATVILPEKLVRGARATLAVLDADGQLVPGAVVELSSGAELTTDVTGRAVFSAPAEAGELRVRLQGGDAAFTAAVVPPASESPEPAPQDAGGAATASGAAAAGVVFPRLIALGSRFALGGGGFRGDAARDRVTVGGEPALVLAASPDSLVALPNPRTPLGAVPMVVEVAGRELGAQEVSVVSLSVSGPEKPLAAGEMGSLTVRVNGSAERLIVEIRNLSPTVIEILRGDVARVATGGGGSNTATIRIAGVKPGNYAVSARVLPGIAGLPDVEGARRELLAARRLARGRWRERLDRVIHRIEHDPGEVARIRDEIAQLMAEHPPKEVAVRLQVAWNTLEAP